MRWRVVPGIPSFLIVKVSSFFIGGHTLLLHQLPHNFPQLGLDGAGTSSIYTFASWE